MNESQLSSGAVSQLSEVNIHAYGSFLDDLLQLANQSDLSKIWISSSASQAIFSRIPEDKRLISSNLCIFLTQIKSIKYNSRFTS